MTDLHQHFPKTIANRQLFSRGQSILVAVSGGVDSVVLLELLHRLAEEHHWQLIVAHYNHHLRGRSSTADARFVQRLAAAKKLKCIVGSGQVRAVAEAQGWSIEMAARELRHQFLAHAALDHHCHVIALAHHADDQTELFFLRLLRGAGPDGLSGMAWRNPSPASEQVELVRPLLDIPKQALVDIARKEKLRFREDATNTDKDILRNRIRHRLLPELQKHFQPAIYQTVPRLMETLAAETDFVRQAVAAWPTQKPQPPFSQLAIALQRRLIQQQLWHLGIKTEFDLIEHLRLQAETPIMVAPTMRLQRTVSGVVEVVPVEAADFNPENLSVDLAKAGTSIAFGDWQFTWQFQRKRGVELPVRRTPQTEFFDADKVGGTVTLRHWLPGDRFQPIGLAQPVKLQDLFTNQKLSAAARRARVVATTATGEIFWVEGVRIAERFRLDKGTVRRLKWRWLRP